MISEPLWKIKNQLCINQKQSSYKYLNTIMPRHDKKITKTKENNTKLARFKQWQTSSSSPVDQEEQEETLKKRDQIPIPFQTITSHARSTRNIDSLLESVPYVSLIGSLRYHSSTTATLRTQLKRLRLTTHQHHLPHRSRLIIC